MFKREKKPKPWEQEDAEHFAPPAEGDDAEHTETYDMVPSPSPVSGTEDPDEEALLPPELLEQEIAKPKKKRNPKMIVFLIIVILIVAVLLVQLIMGALKGPDPTYAEFDTVQRGDIEQTLSSSGLIQTADKRTLFSPATAPISTADLELGSVVSAGTQVFTFDTTELERSVSTARAADSLSGLQAQQARNESAEAQGTTNEYQSSMTTMQQQREIARGRLTEAEHVNAALQAELSPQIATLQQELQSLRDQHTSLLTSDSAAAAALQPQIDQMAAQLAALEGQLQQASTAVQAAQADLEQHNGLVSQLENLRDQAEQGVLDANGQAQLGLQGVQGEMALATAQDQLEAARLGVTAPITGVVTVLEAEEGALANQYAPLCTIESLEQVDVLLSLSRYDLERVQVGQSATITTVGHTYTGQVTKIDSMATTQTTQSGTTNYVGATVSIANPDDNITLGIEANVEIHTGQADGVLMVPTSAVNTDVDGSYVFVNEGGIAHRKTVETGLSSDTYIEITSGLSEGESVILSSQNITEGMNVSDDPAYMDSADMMSMMM
ncbi:efflux RND transporter periplasmic adaptor subunit [Ruminococcaceae bacterium OttesenSCG-928-I18]|nr:efflux RND transporter periplasmic adaptor subunit [Ruminococcaceae bacterium OttesenSCG-928-I18]